MPGEEIDGGQIVIGAVVNGQEAEAQLRALQTQAEETQAKLNELSRQGYGGGISPQATAAVEQYQRLTQQLITFEQQLQQETQRTNIALASSSSTLEALNEQVSGYSLVQREATAARQAENEAADITTQMYRAAGGAVAQTRAELLQATAASRERAQSLLDEAKAEAVNLEQTKAVNEIIAQRIGLAREAAAASAQVSAANRIEAATWREVHADMVANNATLLEQLAARTAYDPRGNPVSSPGQAGADLPVGPLYRGASGITSSADAIANQRSSSEKQVEALNNAKQAEQGLQEVEAARAEKGSVLAALQDAQTQSLQRLAASGITAKDVDTELVRAEQAQRAETIATTEAQEAEAIANEALSGQAAVLLNAKDALSKAQLVQKAGYTEESVAQAGLSESGERSIGMFGRLSTSMGGARVSTALLSPEVLILAGAIAAVASIDAYSKLETAQVRIQELGNATSDATKDLNANFAFGTESAASLTEALAGVSGQLAAVNHGMVDGAAADHVMQEAEALHMTTGEGLNEATKAIVGTLQRFNLEASDSATVANALLDSGKSLDMTTGAVADKFGYLHETLSEFNPTFEDTKAIFDAAAKSGGEEGLMRVQNGIGAGFEQLLSRTKAENEALDKYHLVTVDAAENTLPLKTILLEIVDAYDRQTSSGAKAEMMNDLFGSQARNITPVIEGLSKAIHDGTFETGGNTDAMKDAARQYDTTAGRADYLKSHISDLATEFGKTLVDAVFNASQELDQFLQKTGKLGEQLGLVLSMAGGATIGGLVGGPVGAVLGALFGAGAFELMKGLGESQGSPPPGGPTVDQYGNITYPTQQPRLGYGRPAPGAAGGATTGALLPSWLYAAWQAHESTMGLPTPGSPEPMFGMGGEGPAGSRTFSSEDTTAPLISSALYNTTSEGEAALDAWIRRNVPDYQARINAGDWSGLMAEIAPKYYANPIPGRNEAWASEVLGMRGQGDIAAFDQGYPSAWGGTTGPTGAGVPPGSHNLPVKEDPQAVADKQVAAGDSIKAANDSLNESLTRLYNNQQKGSEKWIQANQQIVASDHQLEQQKLADIDTLQAGVETAIQQYQKDYDAGNQEAYKSDQRNLDLKLKDLQTGIDAANSAHDKTIADEQNLTTEIQAEYDSRKQAFKDYIDSVKFYASSSDFEGMLIPQDLKNKLEAARSTILSTYSDISRFDQQLSGPYGLDSNLTDIASSTLTTTDVTATTVKASSLSVDKLTGNIIGDTGVSATQPWVSPVTGYQITQGFGPASPDVAGVEPGGMHEGVDLAVAAGTAVEAATAGTVTYVDNQIGKVTEAIGNGFELVYEHMDPVLVKVGDQLSAGQQISNVGDHPFDAQTWPSTGPHLHYQVDDNGSPVDPLPFLPYKSTGGVPDALSSSDLSSLADAIRTGTSSIGTRVAPPAPPAPESDSVGILPASWYAAWQADESGLPLPSEGSPEPMFGMGGTGPGGTRMFPSKDKTMPPIYSALYNTLQEGVDTLDAWIEEHVPDFQKYITGDDFEGLLNELAPTYYGNPKPGANEYWAHLVASLQGQGDIGAFQNQPSSSAGINSLLDYTGPGSQIDLSDWPTNGDQAPGDYGLRTDGTPKGNGYYGPIQLSNGNVMTELSVGVTINGQEMDIPSLVPGLNASQIDQLKNVAVSGGDVPQDIVDLATQFAQQRIAAGQSPFAGPEDQTQPLPTDQTDNTAPSAGPVGGMSAEQRKNVTQQRSGSVDTLAEQTEYWNALHQAAVDENQSAVDLNRARFEQVKSMREGDLRDTETKNAEKLQSELNSIERSTQAQEAQLSTNSQVERIQAQTYERQAQVAQTWQDRQKALIQAGLAAQTAAIDDEEAKQLDKIRSDEEAKLKTQNDTLLKWQEQQRIAAAGQLQVQGWLDEAKANLELASGLRQEQIADDLANHQRIEDDQRIKDLDTYSQYISGTYIPQIEGMGQAWELYGQDAQTGADNAASAMQTTRDTADQAANSTTQASQNRRALLSAQAQAAESGLSTTQTDPVVQSLQRQVDILTAQKDQIDLSNMGLQQEVTAIQSQNTVLSDQLKLMQDIYNASAATVELQNAINAGTVQVDQAKLSLLQAQQASQGNTLIDAREQLAVYQSQEAVLTAQVNLSQAEFQASADYLSLTASMDSANLAVAQTKLQIDQQANVTAEATLASQKAQLDNARNLLSVTQAQIDLMNAQLQASPQYQQLTAQINSLQVQQAALGVAGEKNTSLDNEITLLQNQIKLLDAQNKNAQTGLVDQQAQQNVQVAQLNLATAQTQAQITINGALQAQLVTEQAQAQTLSEQRDILTQQNTIQNEQLTAQQAQDKVVEDQYQLQVAQASIITQQEATLTEQVNQLDQQQQILQQEQSLNQAIFNQQTEGLKQQEAQANIQQEQLQIQLDMVKAQQDEVGGLNSELQMLQAQLQLRQQIDKLQSAPGGYGQPNGLNGYNPNGTSNQASAYMNQNQYPYGSLQNPVISGSGTPLPFGSPVGATQNGYQVITYVNVKIGEQTVQEMVLQSLANGQQMDVQL